MCWQLVIDYPHKSFDDCCGQGVALRQEVMDQPKNKLSVALKSTLQML